MALKMAVFGIANLAYAAEINFTTCDLCLRNPNAIALAERPASLQKFHVSARHLLSFAASLSVPPLREPPQSAHSISPCTPKELLN
jgi:hypothetical protein